ncbi:MAG TPA: tetratricopeptide repeat protein [Candidatus Binatia bacterium]|jgi:Ca-activated chloride channel family protein|nr:tetratricopeptide repeat protein [Candidatus Binatia bacterium]
MTKRAWASSLAAVGTGLVWAWWSAGSVIGMWLTPDQHAALVLRGGNAGAAATTFRDPMWRGVALYRDGAFADAAATFARVDGAVASFDAGNALLMAGKYDDAIASYDRALSRRPDWREARVNRELAEARRDAKAPPADGDEGTEGQVAPDQVVDDGKGSPGDDEAPSTQATGDADLQALWLRRVQTTPAEFLRAKFAYQASRRQGTP